MIPHISDQIIVTGSMTSLRRIHITGACLVSDVGICWIIRHSPSLEDVDISYCNSITDQALIAFGTNSKSLRALNIAGLGHITDIGITALAEGCRALKKLNLTACNKVTNLGLQSLSHLIKLESLNLSCCDLISDEGILSFSSSLHSLKSLDLSNCDQITLLSLSSLINSPNLSLTKLHCLGCNILSLDYHKLTKTLPLARAQTSKCRLEPRHPSLVRYNTLMMTFNSSSKNFIIVQSLVRGWIHFKKYHRYLQQRLRAILTVQRVWRGYQSRIGTYQVLKAQKKYVEQVIHLQRSMRRLHAISLTKRKKRYLLRRYRATLLLQRVSRGFIVRTRLYHRLKNRPKYRSKFFYLSQKIFILRSIRHVHTQIVTVQAALRKKLFQSRYTAMRRGFLQLQLLIRIFLSVRRVMRTVVEEMVCELSVQENAVETIIKTWRAKRYNVMLQSYVYDCAVVYRNDQDMKEWLYEQETDSVLKIQTIFRGFLARKRYEILKRRHREGAMAIILIQKYLRRYIQRIKFVPWREKMRRVFKNWKKLYLAERAYFYRKQVRVIQRTLKKNVFLRQRRRAAGVIYRVYRGHQARTRVRQMIFEIHSGLSGRIQRVWRAYQDKRARHFRFVRRHIAARRIQVRVRGSGGRDEGLTDSLSQRAVKRRLERKAKQRVIAAKKAKALEMELKRKEKLLQDKRRKVACPHSSSLTPSGSLPPPSGDRQDQDDSHSSVCNSHPTSLEEIQTRDGEKESSSQGEGRHDERTRRGV
jgi:hypothetical protein